MVDLVTELGTSQANVSGHLACLKDCGLVAERAQGRANFYRLARPELAVAVRHCSGGTRVSSSSPTTQTALPQGSPAWQKQAKLARLLSWLSLIYMAAEGAIAVTAAIIAGSVALLGFGLDSVI